jgi:hypothetical protein
MLEPEGATQGGDDSDGTAADSEPAGRRGMTGPCQGGVSCADPTGRQRADASSQDPASPVPTGHGDSERRAAGHTPRRSRWADRRP